MSNTKRVIYCLSVRHPVTGDTDAEAVTDPYTTIQLAVDTPDGTGLHFEDEFRHAQQWAQEKGLLFYREEQSIEIPLPERTPRLSSPIPQTKQGS